MKVKSSHCIFITDKSGPCCCFLWHYQWSLAFQSLCQLKILWIELRPEIMKRMCCALVRPGVAQLPYSVTSTNISRWEWKGLQHRKKVSTTATTEYRGHSQMTLQHWTTNGNLKSWRKLTRRDQGSSETMMNDEKSNDSRESIQKRP